MLQHLAKQTGGSIGVPMHERHFGELLTALAAPPLLAADTPASLIEMGFPRARLAATQDESLCVDHGRMTRGGFLCPRCGGKHCDLPAVCGICRLNLARSPHLARSYHHLFPVPLYAPLAEEVVEAGPDARECAGCHSAEVDARLALQCPLCEKTFCPECNDYIHNSLYTCPGCQEMQSRPKE